MSRGRARSWVSQRWTNSMKCSRKLLFTLLGGCWLCSCWASRPTFFSTPWVARGIHREQTCVLNLYLIYWVYTNGVEQHFSPSSVLFKKDEYYKIVGSNVGLIVVSSVLTRYGMQFGFAAVLKQYIIPYLVCSIYSDSGGGLTLMTSAALPPLDCHVDLFTSLRPDDPTLSCRGVDVPQRGTGHGRSSSSRVYWPHVLS